MPLFLLLAFLWTTTVYAEDLYHADFNSALSRETWKFLRTPKTLEGQLVLETPPDSAAVYTDCGISTLAGIPALNFVKQPVRFILSGISMGGSAPDKDRVLQVIIGSDSAKETEAKGYVRLRLAATGLVIVAFNTEKNGKRVEQKLLSIQSNGTIEEVSLNLEVSGAEVVVRGSQGEVKTAEKWDSLDPAPWEKSAPWLTVKATRSPSEGNTLVTLRSIRVEKLNP